MVVAALLVIRRDGVQIIAAESVLLRQFPGFLHQHPALNENIRLALNRAVIGVAEHDLRVHQDFRSYSALGVLPGLHIRVPVCIHAPVRVHSRVPAELPDTAAHFVMLKDGDKLVIENVGQSLHHSRVHAGA